MPENGKLGTLTVIEPVASVIYNAGTLLFPFGVNLTGLFASPNINESMNTNEHSKIK